MPELAICRAVRTSETQDRDQTHSSLRKKCYLITHTEGGWRGGKDAEKYVGLNPPAWWFPKEDMLLADSSVWK